MSGKLVDTLNVIGRTEMQRLLPNGLGAILMLGVVSVVAGPIEPVSSESTTLIKVDGSSTVFPIDRKSTRLNSSH